MGCRARRFSENRPFGELQNIDAEQSCGKSTEYGLQRLNNVSRRSLILSARTSTGADDANRQVVALPSTQWRVKHVGCAGIGVGWAPVSAVDLANTKRAGIDRTAAIPFERLYRETGGAVHARKIAIAWIRVLVLVDRSTSLTSHSAILTDRESCKIGLAAGHGDNA